MKMEIKKLIKDYARIYQAFEEKQDGRILPGGDQKTGVIAEYYAKCYIEKTFNVVAEYAKSGKSYDLSYTLNNNELIKVQVKAVSSHSKTRTIAPINLKIIDGKTPFDNLYLIGLNESFVPEAFYINTYIDISQKLKQSSDTRERIVGSTLKGKSLHSIEKTGHWLFNFSVNKVKELNEAIL